MRQLSQDDAGLYAHLPAAGRARRSRWLADTGPIGGDLSHEFIILAPTGESQVFYDAAFEEIDYGSDAFDARQSPSDLAAVLRADDRRTTPRPTRSTTRRAWAKVAPARRREGRGIEVGHIFYFGTKYSEPMGLHVAGPDGKPVHPGDGQLRHRRLPPGRRA